MVNYLIVEDKETFETILLRSILDARGRTVRWCRFDECEAEQVGGFLMTCSWGDLDKWQMAKLGESYSGNGIKDALLLYKLGD